MALTAAAGCGYHVLATNQVYGMTAIAVVPFAEDMPVGLSTQLAYELSSRLAAGGLHVVTDESAASAILSGRVISAISSVSPVAQFNATVPAYDMTVTLTVELVPKNGKAIWKKRMVIREDFLAAGTIASGTATGPQADPTLATEVNRRRALLRVAEQAAQDIVDALLIDSTTAPGSP